MKRFLTGFLIPVAFVAALAVGGGAVLGGCGALTPEKQERIEALEKENADLALKIDGFIARAKETGDINLLEIAAVVEPLKGQIKRNLDTIKEIQAEAGSAGVIGALAGLLGRTVLHFGTKLPVSGAAGTLLQGLLGLLLGGSTTGKKAEVEAKS